MALLGKARILTNPMRAVARWLVGHLGRPRPWRFVASELLSLHPKIWPGPHRNQTPLQRVADFFGMRALRRVMALEALFRKGLYVEAHAVVRAGYEDWVTFAYIIRGGKERSIEFLSDVNKTDARVYDAYKKLCGEAAARLHFPDLVPGVAKYVGKPRSSTRVMRGVDLAARANEVGLADVHGYVYEWLSAYAQPTSRSYPALFEKTEAGVRVRRPRRDNREEAKLAMWAWWFDLRILTLAGRQYGLDLEPLSEELLFRKTNDLWSCVQVRESVKAEEGLTTIRASEVKLPLELDPQGVDRKKRQEQAIRSERDRRNRRSCGATLTHPACPQPKDENCVLWRYMKVEYFEWLTEHGALYFTRGDRFPDTFEGSIPRPVERWRDGYMSKGCAEEAEFLAGITREWTYVNCWHCSEHESTAMWDTYGRGVAIVTRYRRLAQCLPEDVLLGEVTYIDYRSDGFSPVNAFYPLMHKRLPFRHEQEVRALLPMWPPDWLSREVQKGSRFDDEGDQRWWFEPNGAFAARGDVIQEAFARRSLDRNGEIEAPLSIPIPVNLKRLLVKVVMSPGMNPEHRQRVQDAAHLVSKRLRVEASELEAKPKY